MSSYKECNRKSIVKYLNTPLEDGEEELLSLNHCPPSVFFSLKVERIPFSLSASRIKEFHYSSFKNLFIFDWDLIPHLTPRQLNVIPWSSIKQEPPLYIKFKGEQILELNFNVLLDLFQFFPLNLDDSFCSYIHVDNWKLLLEMENVKIPLNALSAFTIVHFLVTEWMEINSKKLSPQHWNRLGDSYRNRGFRHPCKMITDLHYSIDNFWEGINAECLRELPVLSSLPQLIVKKIPKTTIFTFNEEDLPFLSPSLGLRVRNEFLESTLNIAVRPIKSPSQGICSFLEPEDLEIFSNSGDISMIGRLCFESISPITLNKMTSHSISLLPDYLIGCLSGDQIMHLQERFFIRMNREKYAFLGHRSSLLQCSGFIGHHIGIFQNLKILFSSECLSQLNPAFFSLLLKNNALELMDHPFWSNGLNRLQIASLSTEEIVSLIPEEKMRIIFSTSSSFNPISPHFGFSTSTWKIIMEKWDWILNDYSSLIPFFPPIRQSQHIIDRFERMHLISTFII